MKRRRDVGQKQKSTKRKLALFFTLTVVAIILVTVAMVWFFGFVLVATGIESLADITVSSSFYVVAALISSAIIGSGLSVLAGKFFLRPFNDLINGMMTLSQGDYTARLELGSLNRLEPFRSISDGFNDMARELDNTQIMRGDFINSFSHEFKTPVASINGLIALLKKENLPEAKRREYLLIIEEETNRLFQLSSNVLSISKLENESILKGVEEYNISEQIRSCILLLEKKWAKKNLSLSLDFEEYTVCANQDMMMQVFINILDNAIKFSHDGGTLGVKIDDPDGYLSVRIENEGVEISPDDLDKIFNKFYQADSTHTKEGNGLGLSIVKHIVELHDGVVEAESKNGITAFTVVIPKYVN